MIVLQSKHFSNHLEEIPELKPFFFLGLTKSFMKDPVVHPSCGNMFCGDCVKSLDKCPVCGGPITGYDSFTRVPRLILGKIADIKVTCDRCHSGMSCEVFRLWHLPINKISDF